MSSDLHLHLQALETALRESGLWSHQPPAADALLSVQPFCVDTLNFSQWLQFVFVPRMAYLLEHQLPLPGSCNISPMAEEALSGLPVGELLRVLREIDTLLNNCAAEN